MKIGIVIGIVMIILFIVAKMNDYQKKQQKLKFIKPILWNSEIIVENYINLLYLLKKIEAGQQQYGEDEEEYLNKMYEVCSSLHESLKEYERKFNFLWNIKEYKKDMELLELAIGMYHMILITIKSIQDTIYQNENEELHLIINSLEKVNITVSVLKSARDSFKGDVKPDCIN